MKMRLKLLAAVLSILICTTIFLACSQQDEAPSVQSGKNAVIPIDVAEVEELVKTRGCPLMLVVMAAWCAPCRAELPTLQRMHEKYKDRGLQIVGISLDIGGPSAMQPLVDQMNVTFPVYWGGEKVGTHYQISGIPLTYLIRNGQVVDALLGQRDEAFIEEKIVTLLDACEKEGAKS